MITHVIVELKYPVEDEYFLMDTVFPNEYYGYGTPLVRCKDCKCWYAGENINYCRKFWDDDGEPKLYRCTADDFCSRAERKEE